MKALILAALLGAGISATGVVSAHADNGPKGGFTIEKLEKLTEQGS